MKYPESQFKKLVETLKVLDQHLEDIKSINVHALHFTCYQQHAAGQEHNKFIVLNDGNIMRKHAANRLQVTGTDLFVNDESFMLYPEGCNDNHIETAMKQALKTI